MPVVDHAKRLEIATESARKFALAGSSQRVVNLLRKMRVPDAATVLGSLSNQERLFAWRALAATDRKFAGGVLTEMPEDGARAMLAELDTDELAAVLRSLPTDDAGYLHDLLPKDVLADEDEAERTISPELAAHLFYKEETAGRIMATNVFAVQGNLTVGETIRAVQERADQFEMVFYLYVVDERRHLIGVVSLRQLLLHTPSTPLHRIMIDDVISVRADTDQEEVAQTIARYNLLAVPVVDTENRLAGIITVDDAIDVLREEATEDILALAGVSADERLTSPPGYAIRRRLPWIYINLVTAAISVSVIHFFEGTIEALPTLAALFPIVAGLGGNAGTQALTVVVRGIALGELSESVGGRVLVKEALVGLANGTAAGVGIGTAVGLWTQNVWLGAVLGAAMVANMFVAAIAGTFVPMAFRRFGFDPATGSSIFVTACTDMTGFAVFLGLATALFAYLK